jgi:hypothetical protein
MLSPCGDEPWYARWRSPSPAVRAPSTPTSPKPRHDTPWSRGVTDAAKAQAQALLEEGNALIVQNLFREALAKYEAALAAWDHPAIRFNMVRALIASIVPSRPSTTSSAR